MATGYEVGELLHQRGWRTAFTVGECVNAWADALPTLIARRDRDRAHHALTCCDTWRMAGRRP